jgi:DNA-binding PadR family transcriptional regulator
MNLSKYQFSPRQIAMLSYLSTHKRASGASILRTTGILPASPGAYFPLKSLQRRGFVVCERLTVNLSAYSLTGDGERALFELGELVDTAWRIIVDETRQKYTPRVAEKLLGSRLHANH